MIRPAVGFLWHWLTWPFRQVGQFFSEWTMTRNWRWLLDSVPALVVALGIVVGIVRAQWASDESLAVSYTTRARKAYNENDFHRAEMLYRKAVRFRPNDQALVFDRALLLEKLDNPFEAFRLMESIAALDAGARSLPKAHLWLARSALNNKALARRVRNRVLFADQHLSAILRQHPDHVEAHRLLAGLAVSLGNGTKAIKHLRPIVEKYPETRIALARLLDASGNDEDARHEATRCFEFYKQTLPGRMADSENPPSAAEWVNWASSAALLDRYPEAAAILVDARKVCEEQDVLRNGLATVFLEWSTWLDRQDDQNLNKQLELLGQAVEVAPNHPQVLGRLGSMLDRGDETPEKVEAILRKILIDGDAPAIVHFLLGTLAAKRNDSEGAESRLQQAKRLNPGTPVVLNNLAWVIGRDEKRVEEALGLVDQAIKLDPYQPNFRETRGQFLIRLGRWRDGIADLEIANRSLRNRPAIHKSLAEAYDKIGDKNLAEEHRKRYQALLESTQPKDASD